MYQVVIRQSWAGDETVIHSAHNNPVKLPSAQVTLDTAAIPSFSFNIYPGNPGYSSLQYMVTLVRVRDIRNQIDLFEGRILTPSEPLEQDGMTYKQITCEGLAAFLHDSRPSFVEYSGKTRLQILTSLVDMHNTQMTDGGSAYKCFKLGNVDLGTTKAAYCYTDESISTYDNITNLVLNAGYELSARHESDGIYLDCAKIIGETGSQVIELKRNLITFTRSIDPTSLVTAFMPLGQAAETTDTDSSTERGTARLTITSANNGSPLLRDEKLIKQFGLIIGANTWDDVTDATTLKTTGQAYFNALNTATIATQVQAVDMTIVGEDTQPLRNGWSYRTRIPFKGIDEVLRIKQATIDLNDPTANTYTMGDRVVGQESYNVELANQLAGMRQYNGRLQQLQLANATAVQKAQEALDATNDLKKQVAALEASGDGANDGTTYDPTGMIIDVSEYQGTIDWTKVTAAGLALAVIEVQRGSSVEDAMYKTNIADAVAAGANYGVYAYFKAISEADAKVEAKDFYDRAQSAIGSLRQPRLYMIDVENNTVTSGTLKAAVSAYMDELNALGVPDSKIVIYVSTSLYGSIDTSRPAALWVPRYGTNDGTVAGSTKPDVAYDLWQYTSMGKVSGITANTVDMSTDPSSKFQPFLEKEG